MNRLLWAVQGLLAGLFAFAGVAKLAMPVDPMVTQTGLPGWFFRFIGVCEALGAVGMIVPWRSGIKPGLTPLAAILLIPIMFGAVVTSATSLSLVSALFPAATGLLCGFVAWGRREGITRNMQIRP